MKARELQNSHQYLPPFFRYSARIFFGSDETISTKTCSKLEIVNSQIEAKFLLGQFGCHRNNRFFYILLPEFSLVQITLSTRNFTQCLKLLLYIIYYTRNRNLNPNILLLFWVFIFQYSSRNMVMLVISLKLPTMLENAILYLHSKSQLSRFCEIPHRA